MLSALVFGACLYPWKGSKGVLDFYTAFLVEKSLSVDNLFVFLMLFEYFKVPEAYINRVLTWGILSAIALRGFMIVLGVAAVQKCRPILLVFAIILVLSSIKMFQDHDEGEALADNAIMKFARRTIKCSDEYDGDRFFTKVDGKKVATPLLLVLVCIELSDVVFAVDSIPAVVGITQDTFVVYTSNIFALMALRSLYLILSKAVQDLRYLKPAVALILDFIGGKMILEYFEEHHRIHLGSLASLGVVSGILVIGVVSSLIANSRDKQRGIKSGSV